MPIYEYECLSCGNRIEVLQRVSDPPLESCDCGEEGTLKKLISAPAFQFKGEGWYVTDYARKKAEGNGKGEKAEAKGDGAGDKSASENSTKAERLTKPESIQKNSTDKGTKAT